MDHEQENICRLIDQRAKDQATVRWFERQHDEPQIFWTGRMTVTNRFVQLTEQPRPPGGASSVSA